MSRHERVHGWLKAGVAAVDPERLVREQLPTSANPRTVLAIGKAAPAMCRGASTLGEIDGLCITSHAYSVPESVEVMIGDHPYPAEASVRAGLRAIEVASSADIAFISGGGSALCEVPAEGLSIGFVADVYRKLLESGTAITEVNIVRSHLSQIKAGRLGPLPTYVISDVAGAPPEVVSSGPTVHARPDPERAISIMRRVGVPISTSLAELVRRHNASVSPGGPVVVLVDGKTAAEAVVAAVDERTPARVRKRWIGGDLNIALREFIENSPPGVTVAAGEPSVSAGSKGRGGRNTHAALSAARMIEGTATVFAAFATGGVDGSSRSAGAIVDGKTLARGGDPEPALSRWDSATYLANTGDLIEAGPTGTNVADLWLLWRPSSVPTRLMPRRARELATVMESPHAQR